MLSVLLVDDEPYITQGLAILIDWEKMGYIIVGTVSNGVEAVAFLKSNTVDVIIADIKMPLMSGIELLKKIREEQLSEAFLVIVSGYSDFQYAQNAIQYRCMDYILKPVQKSQLLALLERISASYETRKQEKLEREKMGKAFFTRYIQALILGRAEEENIAYIKEKVAFSEHIRYIEIELDYSTLDRKVSVKEKRQMQRLMYHNCLSFIGKENEMLCFMDALGSEDTYDVGFIYYNALRKREEMTEKAYFEALVKRLQVGIEGSVVIYVGSVVSRIEELSKSYRTAIVAKSFQSFKLDSNILYYTEEKKTSSGLTVSKENIDALLESVEQNDPDVIEECVNAIYDEMNELGMHAELIQMNINYLLMQLVHLAIKQDASLNQGEILDYIKENAFESQMIRGSKIHFEKFIKEYADYLGQLRKNMSGGILAKIEKEVEENYARPLTLKDLGKKYYVNSAYLGQVFRKQYKMSFKDYLNQYRIEKAANLLSWTDQKVYAIAEQVGYHDLDYFINKFIMLKGCTPTSFRKKAKMQ